MVKKYAFAMVSMSKLKLDCQIYANKWDFDAHGTLARKNRAKNYEKGVNMGTFGFSIKFPIDWWCTLFSSFKNLGEK